MIIIQAFMHKIIAIIPAQQDEYTLINLIIAFYDYLWNIVEDDFGLHEKLLADRLMIMMG